MFDMERTGAKIAELRKANNMTQMELADRLGISFQAVSNWERGNSMPDISKLPELAKIFSVSIDELLGEEAPLINSAADGKLEEYLDENTVSVEELTQAAPVLKPTQVDTAFKGIKNYSLKELLPILPFLDRKAVDSLAKSAVERGDTDGIEAVCPFASRSLLDELAESVFESRGIRAIVCLAPFLSRNRIGKIARLEFEKNGISKIVMLAPFMDRKALNELAEDAIKKEGISAIVPLMPFLGKIKFSGDDPAESSLKDGFRFK